MFLSSVSSMTEENIHFQIADKVNTVGYKTEQMMRSQKAERTPPDPVHHSDINYEGGCELFMWRWT